MNPAVMIPAGKAITGKPAKESMLLKVLPSTVTGTMSPYPIEVTVTTAYHMVAGMLENLSGCARCSAK